LHALQGQTICEDRGICEAITQNAVFRDVYWSNTTLHKSLLREGEDAVRLSYKRWLSPVTVLQKGTCADLPNTGCGIFEDSVKTHYDVFFPAGLCSTWSPVTPPGYPADQGLWITQRCASQAAEPTVQDEQDQLELFAEWNDFTVATACIGGQTTASPRFKIERAQWKEGPEGAQYICLDMPKPVGVTADALRMVMLSVGNLPCEGVINPPTTTTTSQSQMGNVTTTMGNVTTTMTTATTTANLNGTTTTSATTTTDTVTATMTTTSAAVNYVCASPFTVLALAILLAASKA